MFVAIALICGVQSSSGCVSYAAPEPVPTEDACWELQANAREVWDANLPPGVFVADQQCVTVSVQKQG